MEIFIAILTATIVAGTPLLFAALGELVTERSGVLNLGIEGMMLVGAVCAFGVTMETGSTGAGIAASALAGVALALIFAFATLTLQANQVASGLALAILGTGLSAFVGKAYVGTALIADQSAAGEILQAGSSLWSFLTSLHMLDYLSWALFVAILWFLYRSRAGLVLRAVGESPSSAHALGYPVIRIRYLATLFGGAMAGIAGGYLAVVYTSLWTEGMTAGRGWIALALVVFATWRPERVLLGAYLFGGVTTVQLFAQGAGIRIPPEAMSALPYLATIIVLVVISRNVTLIGLNAPAALGQSYHPDS